MSMVSGILRAEHVAVAVTGVIVYLAFGGPYLLIFPALLAPDLSMAGYLAGPRVGAVTYNLVHNLVLALGAIGLGWWLNVTWVVLAGAVLVAHVGMDRALGYGLKLPTSFQDTHLGRIGRRPD
jgi:Domain of unknown function (DUF4260)